MGTKYRTATERSPVFQICPQHSDEEVQGEPLDNDAWRFRCERRGHVRPGPIEWLHVEPPPGLNEGDGICAEYNLYSELKEAIASVASDKWVEYGLIERAYAERRPDDFAALVARYGHTSIKGKRYTVSALLGGALGRLTSRGDVYFRWEPATQYWRYNSRIGWFCVSPVAPDWENRVSCDSTDGYDVRSYVPGAQPHQWYDAKV